MFDFLFICASIILEGDGMEKITTEVLLTTLFEYGFEKVDPVLFTLVLGKASIDDANKQEFDFRFDIPLTKSIVRDGIMYKLSDDVDKDLWFRYHSNEILLKYLTSLNFEEIITKKLEGYGYDKMNCILGTEKIDENLFSQKELEMIDLMTNKNKKALFGITDEITKKREIMQEMVSNNDYIDWLLEFTITHNNQFYDDTEWDYVLPRIGDKDNKNIKKLYIFFELVSEYAEQHQCTDGYFCKIKYNDEVINVGVLHGLGAIHYASIAPKIDEHGNPKFGYDIGAMDYSEIIENYTKYNKQKVHKKQS